MREVTRMFENAGAARTERSIIYSCQPNRQASPTLELSGILDRVCVEEMNERPLFMLEADRGTSWRKRK
jgi:hypothetical protein